MEEQAETAPVKKSGLGCGTIIAIAVILVMLVFVGGNAVMGYFLQNCSLSEDPFDCLFNKLEEPEPQGSVKAIGVYNYDDYSVTVTANIPLEGGSVTGSITGTCDGQLKGSYNGEDNGQISGVISGSCSPFFVNIPAGATFNGIVNKDNKNVPINFVGKGAGLTHQGSMTLKY